MESPESFDVRLELSLTRGLSLRARAEKIDPRSAVCFSGYYGEDFPLDRGGTQRQVASALVWSDGVDCVPDWAMREAWAELEQEWELLQTMAWERHSGPRSARGKNG